MYKERDFLLAFLRVVAVILYSSSRAHVADLGDVAMRLYMMMSSAPYVRGTCSHECSVSCLQRLWHVERMWKKGARSVVLRV